MDIINAIDSLLALFKYPSCTSQQGFIVHWKASSTKNILWNILRCFLFCFGELFWCRGMILRLHPHLAKNSVIWRKVCTRILQNLLWIPTIYSAPHKISQYYNFYYHHIISTSTSTLPSFLPQLDHHRKSRSSTTPVSLTSHGYSIDYPQGFTSTYDVSLGIILNFLILLILNTSPFLCVFAGFWFSSLLPPPGT